MLSPDYFHAVWATVAAFVGRYYLTDHRSLTRRLATIEKARQTDAERLNRHDTEQALAKQALENVTGAVDELKAALKENTKETRQMTESVIKLTTIFEVKNG